MMNPKDSEEQSSKSAYHDYDEWYYDDMDAFEDTEDDFEDYFEENAAPSNNAPMDSSAGWNQRKDELLKKLLDKQSAPSITVQKIPDEWVKARDEALKKYFSQHYPSDSQITYTIPPVSNGSTESMEEKAKRVIETLVDMEFEEVSIITLWEHLEVDDAGGKFMMTVLDGFREHVIEYLRTGNSLKLLNYQEPHEDALLYAIEGIDESDQYDILLSFYGEEEAENIDSSDLMYRMDKLVASITEPLWQYSMYDSLY